MAINTAFKRRSSAAARRMPWMRRFGIAPTGTIGQQQRQAGAWVYAGIAGASPSVDPTAGWTAGQRPPLFTAQPRTPLLTAAPRSTLWTAEAPR